MQLLLIISIGFILKLIIIYSFLCVMQVVCFREKCVKKTSMTLMVFALMNFVLAMTAAVFTGILDKVADSLEITVANAGLLNTMYAYGAAFGVPITLIVLRKIERIKMLKIMLGVTILTALVIVLAKNFGVLLVIRLIMGVAANSYGVLAITTVMELSDKKRQGRSMALLITGNALAFVIGVPLTRALSSMLMWRDIFWILNAIMVVSIIYFIVCLPGGDHESTRLNLRNELKYFKDKKIVLIVIFTLTMFVGTGAFYTYITPYLLNFFPSAEVMLSVVLVLFGTAGFIGNLIGGHVSDKIGYSKSMVLGAALQLSAVSMIVLFRSFMWLTIASVIFWLMSLWFTGLQLNMGIAKETKNKSSFMISINSSSIQLGNAIGSSMAAVIITLSTIQSIVLVTLITSFTILSIQLISNKKYPSDNQ